MIYSAKLSSGAILPDDLILFEAETLDFTVESDDSTLADSFDIIIEATSNDSRWLGQTLTSNFMLTTSIFSTNTDNYV